MNRPFIKEENKHLLIAIEITILFIFLNHWWFTNVLKIFPTKMLTMRRESDNNLSSNSSNTPHGNFPSGDNNLSHLNYHPIHGYGGASNYSGYQSSKIRSEREKKSLQVEILRWQCSQIFHLSISSNSAAPT